MRGKDEHTPDIGLLLDARRCRGIRQIQQHGHAARDAEVDRLCPRVALCDARRAQEHARLDRRQRRVVQIQQPLRLPRIRPTPLPRRELGQLRVRREAGRQARDAEEDDLRHAPIAHGGPQRRAVEEAVEGDVDVAEVQVDELLGERGVGQERRGDEAGRVAVLLVEGGVAMRRRGQSTRGRGGRRRDDGLELDGAEDALLGAVVAARALPRALAFPPAVTRDESVG